MSTQPADDLADLRKRLVYARDALEGNCATATDRDTVNRLHGKAQGVKLALSYLDEIVRTERA